MADTKMLLEMLIQLRGVGEFTKSCNTISTDLTHVTKTVEKANSAGETWRKVGMVAAGVGAAVGFASYKGVQSYEDLQERIDSVATSLGGLNDKQREAVDLWAKHQSVVTGFSSSQYVDALYQATSAGESLDTGQAVAAVAGKVARVTKGDAPETVKALTTLMMNFDDKTKSATQNAALLGDKLTAIQTTGKWSSLSDLQYALSEGAPSAIGFGISIDQTLGALSAFAAAGEDGTKAGTSFREITAGLTEAQNKLGIGIIRTKDGGVDLLATLREMQEQYAGLSTTDRGLLFDKAFGKEGGGRFAEILDHLDAFKKNMDASAGSAGITDKKLTDFQKHGLLAFQQLSQAIANLTDTIAGALAPSFETAAKYASALADRVQKFAEAYPVIVKWGAALTGAAVAAGLLGYGISKVIGAVKAAKAAIIAVKDATWLWNAAVGAVDVAMGILEGLEAATGIAEMIALVALLAGGAYLLYKNWDSVKRVLKEVGAEIEHVLNLITHAARAAEHWVGGEVGKVEHWLHPSKHTAESSGGPSHVTIAPTVHIHAGGTPGSFDPHAHAKAVIKIVDDHYSRKARLSFARP